MCRSGGTSHGGTERILAPSFSRFRVSFVKTIRDETRFGTFLNLDVSFRELEEVRGGTEVYCQVLISCT